jgi:cobalt-zinc-cadmium efflux system protein
MGERVTIGLMRIFGHEVWAGWVMIAALTYSIFPPVILGRKKLPLARRLQDKVLHTDAQMNKADWQTGLAGIGGVIGIGFGLWWADAAAAGIISFSILKDGIGAMRSATAELIDGAPRALGSDEVAQDATRLKQALEHRFPGARVKLRETGRYIRAVVEGAEAPDETGNELWPKDMDRSWRLFEVTFRKHEDDAPREGGG